MRTLVSLLVYFLLSFSSPAIAQLSNTVALPGASSSSQKFVPVDQAFAFSHFQQGKFIYLDWQVKPDYYLYRHTISVTGTNVELGDIVIPKGQEHKDEFFGEVNIFTSPLSIAVPIDNIQPGAQLTVQYQGCAKAGFCYPPETKIINIESPQASSSVPNDSANAQAKKC